MSNNNNKKTEKNPKKMFSLLGQKTESSFSSTKRKEDFQNQQHKCQICKRKTNLFQCTKCSIYYCSKCIKQIYPYKNNRIKRNEFICENCNDNEIIYDEKPNYQNYFCFICSAFLNEENKCTFLMTKKQELEFKNELINRNILLGEKEEGPQINENAFSIIRLCKNCQLNYFEIIENILNNNFQYIEHKKKKRRDTKVANESDNNTLNSNLYINLNNKNNNDNVQEIKNIVNENNKKNKINININNDKNNKNINDENDNKFNNIQQMLDMSFLNNNLHNNNNNYSNSNEFLNNDLNIFPNNNNNYFFNSSMNKPINNFSPTYDFMNLDNPQNSLNNGNILNNYSNFINNLNDNLNLMNNLILNKENQKFNSNAIPNMNQNQNNDLKNNIFNSNKNKNNSDNLKNNDKLNDFDEKEKEKKKNSHEKNNKNNNDNINQDESSFEQDNIYFCLYRMKSALSKITKYLSIFEKNNVDCNNSLLENMEFLTIIFSSIITKMKNEKKENNANNNEKNNEIKNNENNDNKEKNDNKENNNENINNIKNDTSKNENEKINIKIKGKNTNKKGEENKINENKKKELYEEEDDEEETDEPYDYYLDYILTVNDSFKIKLKVMKIYNDLKNTFFLILFKNIENLLLKLSEYATEEQIKLNSQSVKPQVLNEINKNIFQFDPSQLNMNIYNNMPQKNNNNIFNQPIPPLTNLPNFNYNSQPYIPRMPPININKDFPIINNNEQQMKLNYPGNIPNIFNMNSKFPINNELNGLPINPLILQSIKNKTNIDNNNHNNKK